MTKRNLVCFHSNEAIVDAFLHAGVEFVVIGGLAVSWYCPSRTADDMDLLVNPTPENSARIFRALSKLGFGDWLAQSDFARPAVQFSVKQYYYADILTPESGAQTFAEIAADSDPGCLFGRLVRIASASSLIRLKEAAADKAEHDREKHVRDIELLRHLPY